MRYNVDISGKKMFKVKYSKKYILVTYCNSNIQVLSGFWGYRNLRNAVKNESIHMYNKVVHYPKTGETIG